MQRPTLPKECQGRERPRKVERDESSAALVPSAGGLAPQRLVGEGDHQLARRLRRYLRSLCPLPSGFQGLLLVDVVQLWSDPEHVADGHGPQRLADPRRQALPPEFLHSPRWGRSSHVLWQQVSPPDLRVLLKPALAAVVVHPLGIRISRPSSSGAVATAEAGARGLGRGRRTGPEKTLELHAPSPPSPCKCCRHRRLRRPFVQCHCCRFRQPWGPAPQQP
mmetsp:Transcript_126565/g.405127  ORF Transcript_126565/g.405127 Transcript_126565/m.405127 type:complete len:221 (+) Transcript_126565:741-1403(+)